MAQCTCGADQFEGAQHVQDCPAGKETECTCGASAFPGAEHKPECISRLSDGAERYRPPASPQPQQNGPRQGTGRRVEDPSPGTDSFATRVTFEFGVPLRKAFHPASGEEMLVAGQITGKVVDKRVHTHELYGDCLYADLELVGGEFSGMLVSVLCGDPPDPSNPNKGSRLLARLMTQVEREETVQITRELNKGRMHVYTVDILG